MASLDNVISSLLFLEQAIPLQPQLVLLQLALVGRRNKTLLVSKQVVLRLSLLCQPAQSAELSIADMQTVGP